MVALLPMSPGDHRTAYDTAIYAKVTAEAKERLGVLKARLARKGREATDQTIIDTLIMNADEEALESRLPVKPPPGQRRVARSRH